MSEKRVCVFCGGNPGNNPEFMAAARHLGKELARRNWGLVYGGATVGLMGAVADAALEAGGEVIGVIPNSLVQREMEHPGLTRNVRVDTLAQRKQIMFAESDAFLALPGGFGTLDEIFEALTLGQIGEMASKPCVLLNVDGFFNHLLGFLDQAQASGLLLPRYRTLLDSAFTIEQALGLLASRFQAPPPG
jgi:uncharacterized protein (TIGR00730 family)